MGECGCSSNELDIAMIRLGELIMVVSIYLGCDECHQGTGITIKLLNEKSYESFVDTRNIVDLSKELKKDCDDFQFPVLEWEKISKAIEADCTDLSEYESFSDFWHDHQEKCKEAVFETIKEYYARHNSKKALFE